MPGDQADKETIAILGGTGDLGTGLAIRWSKAGYRMIIGSRTLPKAEKAVADLQEISPETPALPMENAAAAAAGDIVVLTVPAAHQLSTLAGVKQALAGKILIDVTVPLTPPKVGTVQLPPEGSAGKRAQNLLGDEVMVVTAFQNVAAHLLKEEVRIECDVLVAGNKKAARDKVMRLVQAAGMTGWHAGPSRTRRRRRRSPPSSSRSTGATTSPTPASRSSGSRTIDSHTRRCQNFCRTKNLC